MKTVVPSDTWPESWKYSYPYDLLEVYGHTSHRGYAYAYANRRRRTLDLVERVAKRGSKILDLAAGQGNFSLAMAELGYEVTWNDMREDLAGYVEIKRERGVIRYHPGNVFDLGYEDTFDVALMTEFIEHVAHPDQLLCTVSRFVKERGYVILSTPNGEYVRNRLPKFSDCDDCSRFEARQFKPDADGHIFFFHRDELETLGRKADLKILDFQLFTNPVTHGFVGTEPVLAVVPRAWIEMLERATGLLPWPLKRRLHTSTAVLFQRVS